ncbi:MAG: hypothetical protein V5A16_00555 [Haloplanus sp.]
MADKKFTLLELHLGDGTVQIGPATLDGGDASDDATESGADDATGNGGCCPGRKVGKLLLALLVLALFALGLKKTLGGGEDLDELEDLADLDEGEA